MPAATECSIITAPVVASTPTALSATTGKQNCDNGVPPTSTPTNTCPNNPTVLGLGCRRDINKNYAKQL